MSQTAANISLGGHYLQVAKANILAGAFKLAGTDKGALRFSETLFQKAAPFYYKERVRVSFSVSENLKEQMGILRGLIEFNRPRHFSFTYAFKQMAIEADVESARVQELQVFLDNIALWLKQEMEFKNSLKRVIEFEKRYRKEMAIVYASLNRTVK